jgi:membrane peptidoglycan carboxypeptidase
MVGSDRSRAGAAVRLLGVCVIAGLIVAGVTFPLIGGLGGLTQASGSSVTASSPELARGDLPAVTTVTDRDGAPIAYLFDQNRTPVPSQAIAPAMKAAIVSIEDRRFYSEAGVDLQGIARAAVNNSSGGGTQGGSTLTQQYVKNYNVLVSAHTESERLKAAAPTIARKVREAGQATQIDHELSKDEILTRYLNLVFLGNGAYGVQSAARTYFNTTADKLTVPQAALLAGMVQSTAAFDPTQHPQAATGRRNEVIRAMAETGTITPQYAAQAQAEPLGITNPVQGLPNGCIGAGDAGFFCSYVLDYLDSVGITRDQLDTGGYTIRTTLDRAALAAAKASADQQVPPTTPHVADVMALVTPGTDRHEVTAMVANRTYGLDASRSETSYDLPGEPENLGAGSVYKIFTSAAYLAQGGGVDDIIPVPPAGYASPIYRNGAGAPIPVGNVGDFPPELSLTDALARSPNTAFVKLEETTGVPAVVDMALKLGMKSLATTPSGVPGKSVADVTRDQKLASFTLGTTPTSTLELANVGATLASHGTWCPPTPIRSVTDVRGQPVPIPESPCDQAVPPTLADTLMNGMSRDDQPAGTSAAAATAAGWNRPIAAKTGTTQDYKSAAFVGATPQLSGAVITFDDSSRPRGICDGDPPTSCGAGNIYGGKTPARTFYDAATQILGPAPVVPLPAPDPRYLTGGRRGTVPTVIGRSVTDAQAALQGGGYQVRTVSVGNRAPTGTVVGQDPQGSALPGDPVTLSVSTGSVAAPPPPPAPHP